MYLILYSNFSIPYHFYHPPYLLLVTTPYTCVDYVTPWRLCQEDMDLMVPHLLGFCYLLSGWLGRCGTYHFPSNIPELPSLDIYKV